MIYVTSDLHGIALSQLQVLLQKAGFSPEDTLFVLGDSIDRGEHGLELLLWMMEQYNIIHLLGNHEEMLLSASDFLLTPIEEDAENHMTEENLGILSTMLSNGAQPTLTALKQLVHLQPQRTQFLLEYLQELPLYDAVEVGGITYVLTHAGLGNFRPDKRLSEYTRQDLLWHRPTPSDRYFGGDTMVLFGHTPTGYYGTPGEIFKTDSWCCIDTSDVSPTLLRLDDWKVFH